MLADDVIFQLTGPMPIMLWIAIIIEAVIGNYADMGILLGIQFINASISFYETSKVDYAIPSSARSIETNQHSFIHLIPQPIPYT